VLDDICRNRHGGNPESEAANESTDKDRGRNLIIEWLSKVGRVGETSDRMAELLNLPTQTCSARCSELKRDGTVIKKPIEGGGYEKRPTRNGRGAAVLVLARFYVGQVGEQLSLPV
jgi:hypothetical protein